MEIDPNRLYKQPRIPPKQPPETKPVKKAKHKDRFGSINHFLDVEARNLSHSECNLWCHLWRETKSDGTCQISHNELARRMGLDRRQAIRLVNKLKGKGFLAIIKKGSNITHESNVYRIHAKPQKVSKG